MNQAQARQWIERHFHNLKRYEEAKAANLPENEYIEALDLLPKIQFPTVSDKTVRELFLHAGCVRFDRWFAPSPSSVPTHYRETFKRFALELQRVERLMMNAPVFIVHAIRDDLYHEFSGVPLPISADQMHRLRHFETGLASISAPIEPVKSKEFTEARLEVTQLISSLLDGSLRSHLKTTVPYALTRQPVDFTMIWEGVSVVGRLRPSFSLPPDILIQVAEPTVLIPRTSTRWQYGKTLVELSFEGLVDPSLQVPALQLPSVDVPINAWPSGLKLAFEIVYQACWELRGRTEFISVWVPAPGDLADIESWITCPGHPNINYIRRGHPSMPYEPFVPSTTTLTLDLGETRPGAWYMRCRVLAEQYSMHGETREALFWLNVGVEALLKERMERRIAAVETVIDLNQLDGADAYWDEARQLIAAKYPTLVDEIEWPKSSQKPSRFRQLKYFCRNVPGAPDWRDATARYSEVSKKRNSLFHGEKEEMISIEEVRVAKEAFEWFVGEFCP